MTRRNMLATMVAAVSFVLLADAAMAQHGGQPVKAVPEAAMARIVDQAPKLPTEMDLGLKTRLIDFIDCTKADDPHDFIDLGSSRVIEGKAGNYRVTAPHRHAFFSYGFRTAGKDKPVLIVIEYPDDEERVISFMTHDSRRAERPHHSFSQETGVYTGGQYPLSNKMRYFTLISWPQDDWSPLLVMNFGNVGGAGAASRIWVYAIDEFEPLDVDAPADGPQRQLDMFFPLAFLAKRDNFGWQSPKSIEHMVDYMKQIGLTRATMMVYANQGWGAMCTIPAWDADDKGNLDDILTQMDRKGGVKLIAGIVAEGMYGVVKAGGKPVAEMEPEELQAIIIKGLDQFIDRYGKYESMGGLAFGSMEAVGFMDLLRDKGVLQQVVAHVKQRRPDWEVVTYVGNFYLQNPHFGGKQSPTAWEVISQWEASAADGGNKRDLRDGWPEVMGRRVVENWQRWKRDPAELSKVEGLDVYEMFMPDDHRLHGLYRVLPRQAMLLDTETNQYRSRHADTPYAAIFGTFTEGYIGLHKQVNWHYTKPWTAPEFNPPAEIGMGAWTRALGLRDRTAISAGGWSVKYFGLEPQMRRFARNFRRLPAVEMTDVENLPVDTVRLRWVMHQGKRYVAVISMIPFDSQVTVDGREINLPPYELVSFVDEGQSAPKLEGQPPANYRQWVADRIARYAALLKEVRALNSEAAPAAYDAVLARAQKALEQGRLWRADHELGAGLLGELELRRNILKPVQFRAKRVDQAPAIDGDLGDWPAAIEPLVADNTRWLAGHVYFTNDWLGANDLSARLHLAHDGTHLLLGVQVRDDVHADKDVIRLALSKGGYLDWRGPQQKFDLDLQMSSPKGDEPVISNRNGIRMAIRRQQGGYVIEAAIPLLEAKFPGGKLGLLVAISDVDTLVNKSSHSWAVKQIMLIPNEPNYPYWNDARTAGEVVLE